MKILLEFPINFA